jgi:hypothetical protein
LKSWRNIDRGSIGLATPKHSQAPMDFMNKTTNELGRSYSEIKSRLGKTRDAIELASIPSEISEDEWAEITKYQQGKDN